MQPQPSSTNKPSATKSKNSKSLLPMQSPIFEIVKKSPQQSDHEYIIRKLMDRKEKKPDIGFVQRSPLFKELEAMMPVIKKSNEQLIKKGVKEQQKIDLQLEQVQNSSSSSDSEEQQHDKDSDSNQEPKMAIINHNKKEKKTKIKLSKQNDMLDELQEQVEKESTQNQIELNFLRYLLPLDPVPIPAASTTIKNENSSNKKKLIEEL